MFRFLLLQSTNGNFIKRKHIIFSNDFFKKNYLSNSINFLSVFFLFRLTPFRKRCLKIFSLTHHNDVRYLITNNTFCLTLVMHWTRSIIDIVFFFCFTFSKKVQTHLKQNVTWKDYRNESSHISEQNANFKQLNTGKLFEFPLFSISFFLLLSLHTQSQCVV